MLVTILLLGAIILGFATWHSMETASGIVTSMSTTTSFYSFRYETSYSTSYITTVVTTHPVFTQTGRNGLYLRITGTLGYYFPPPAIKVDLDITNLMSVPIVRAVLLLTLQYRGGYGNDTVTRDLGLIGPGQTLPIHERLYLNPSLSHYVLLQLQPEIVDVRFEGAIVDFGQQAYTTNSPIAVYAYSRMLTETFVSIYTTTYTMAEPLSADSIGLDVTAALTGVLAIVVVFVLHRRRSTKTSPKAPKKKQPKQTQPKTTTTAHVKTEQKPETSARAFCIHCGAPIPLFAMYCRKCGLPQG